MVSIDLTVRGSKLDTVSRRQEKSTNSETKRKSYSEVRSSNTRRSDQVDKCNPSTTITAPGRGARMVTGRSADFSVGSLRLGLPSDYTEVLGTIKARIQQERLSAVMTANSAMVLLYWDIGHMILERQQHSGWGAIYHLKLRRYVVIELKAVPFRRNDTGWNCRHPKRVSAIKLVALPHYQSSERPWTAPPWSPHKTRFKSAVAARSACFCEQ
ncbi:MAG: DUF1016 N-terminal domain-containing protein [Steroidobacteraceae bacterium]